MSSTVVRSFHPPASLMAAMRHTPAVPGHGNESDAVKMWHAHSPKWRTLDARLVTVEAEEGADGGAHFLLHREVVVQRHLLHPRHQALVRVHWSIRSPTQSSASDQRCCRYMCGVFWGFFFLLAFCAVGSWFDQGTKKWTGRASNVSGVRLENKVGSSSYSTNQVTEKHVSKGRR
jgi:hypothetical protein